MFEHITAGEQAVRANKKNEALTAASGKIAANVDYIAMMCDIELDDDTPALSEVLSPGDHFYANDAEYVVADSVTENGEIIAEEVDNSGEGGADSEQ